MKIYIFHSSGLDYEGELYRCLKDSNLYGDNEIFLPHGLETGTINTLDEIKNSELIVGEVSFPSTGQGI